MDGDIHANIGTAPRHPDSLAKIKTAARKLFTERGYHETRPQDITRAAGLGHGTFYLHYRDKRDCFFAFVDDARTEFHSFMRARVVRNTSIEDTIAQTLQAIYAFSDQNPRLLNAVMADEALIDADGLRTPSAVRRWGMDWADLIRQGMSDQEIPANCDPEIAGQAIVGAMSQCLQEADRMGIPREMVIATLTQMLTQALKANPA
jgi:AcrR family transcriptional regulator